MQPRQFAASFIGQRLLEAGYITEEQLKAALVHQVETGLLLGEVCLLKGWVSYAQLKECLPSLRSRIGDRLLSLGYITAEQLWLALVEQRQSGLRLGDILINRGWVDRSALELLLARPYK